MELEGQTALITGSTAGIGAETARLFGREGAAVVVSGRDALRGEDVVQAIQDAGGEARFVQADLADLASIERLAAAAGDVDILVNNAALFPVAPHFAQTPESFDEAFAVNVRAPYFLSAALAPGMIAKGSGSIVNVTTMAAEIGMAGLSVYGATKAALNSFTRTLAAELADSGVRVNSIAPGPTRTDMVATMGDDAVEQLTATLPVGRLASPIEIAQSILFLASSQSSFVTGSTLAADGGRTAV
jgi:NAD(P)-dependent dehydrogenase (short-subunit alcohol dehydrogenase family)